MNIDELTDALAALSDRAPKQPELRRAVAVRVAVRLRRRRFTALIASVAAVLVVGAGIGGATHRTSARRRWRRYRTGSTSGRSTYLPASR